MIRSRLLYTALAAAFVTIGACGGDPPAPPPEPAPEPMPQEPAVNQDSIDAVRAEEARLERERQEGIRRAATALTAMVFFEYDESTITSEAERILRDKVTVMRANPQVRLRVEGHADERGSTEYNIALGQRRADAIVQFMTSFGIDASRLSTTSYGEERPMERGETESAWSRNRRGEFAITAGEASIQPWTGQ